MAPLPIVMPWAAAALVLFLDRVAPRRLARLATFAAVVLEIATSALLVHQAGAHTAVSWVGGWTPRHGVALGISLSVDPLAAGAALAAGVVVAAAVALLPASLQDAGATVDALALVLLGAMAGFCLTGDLLTMLGFFELTAVAGVALAAYDTGRLAALRGAMSFAITAGIGAVLGLTGVALIYARTGALNLAQIGHSLGTDPRPDRVVIVAVALLSAAFLIRAAVVPFHLWLADTVSAAPLPLVVVLGGALGALGLLGLVRLWWAAAAGALGVPGHAGAAGVPGHAGAGVLVTIGAVTALVGGVLGLGFGAPRRRLAFVVVAQSGITLIGAGLLRASGLAPAVLYSAGSGLALGALVSGLALVDLAHPKAGAALLVGGGLATAGFPLFATGLGLQGLERAAGGAGYPWVVPVIATAAALAGGAALRMARSARSARSAPEAGQPAAARHGPATALGTGIVLLGLAVLASAAGRWAGAAAARVAGTAPAAVPMTLGGTFVDLLSVTGALILGTGYGLGCARGLRRRSAVTTSWGAVRRLHDGSIGDAVTWVTLGAAAIALALTGAMR